MSRARISWIGGPVLRARMEGPFSVYEALAVGPARLLGEVIQLRGDELVAQVYEDTTGLEPGTIVEGSGQPLSVPLGPGAAGRDLRWSAAPAHRRAGFPRASGSNRRDPGTICVHAFAHGGRGPGTGVRARRRRDGAAATPARAARRPRPARLDRRGRRVPGRRARRDLHGPGRTTARDRDAPALARAQRASRGGTAAGQRADDHGPAHPRHALPRGARRSRDAARRLRHGQDGAAGSPRQVVRRRRDRLRRLRRARQRDGGSAGRIPAARGPALRPPARSSAR